MIFERKDLIFGATSRHMESQHLDLVNDDIEKKKTQIENSQKEAKIIKEGTMGGDHWDKLESLEKNSIIKNSTESLQTALKTLEKSPFFGRLDFKEDNNREDICYISKGNISYILPSHGSVNYVNWRAPIASLYYKSHGRPMQNISYIAPRGEISGDISLIAKIKIKDNELEDLSIGSNGVIAPSGSYDSLSTQKTIEDDFQNKLASNSSSKMSEIVETIQSEQDEIIRYDHHQNIIIQGAAGSGKTSIALHRVAYLLYENLQDNEVLFISPNKSFTEYISDVLPELGELNIHIKTFDEIYAKLFGSDVSESFYDMIERYYKNGISINTAQLFDEKIDISMDNIIKISEEVKNKITNLKKALFDISIDDYIKIKKQNSRTKNDLEIETDPSLLTNRKLSEIITIPSYEKIWNSNCRYHYKDPESGKERVFSPEINKNQYTDYIFYAIMRTIIGSKRLFNYTNETNYSKDGTINKNKPIKQVAHNIKHIVVDEAQDYTKWHIYLLHLLCPKATFTILGDKNQNINPYFKDNTLKNILEEVSSTATFFSIENAYRSSPEIIEYTNKILNTNIVARRRSQNEQVDVFNIKSINNISSVDIKNIILKLQDRYTRIGIICRNKDVADYMSDMTEGVYGDITVLPVYAAKGLEFDAAIVINTFKMEKEKELFYTACTRAQHKLVIYDIEQTTDS